MHDKSAVRISIFNRDAIFEIVCRRGHYVAWRAQISQLGRLWLELRGGDVSRMSTQAHVQ